MKKNVLLLLAVLLMSGCATSTRMMQKGRYEAAVEKSVQKLRKNPENEKEIAVLERAFTIANERDLEQIRFLEREGNPRNMESIVQGYSRLRNRQSLVRTVLPLYLGERVINFPYVDYDEKIIAARQQASEFFYHNALELLKRGDKESYRLAWNEFYKVKEYGGMFPGLDSLMEQARYQGISRALVSIQNHSPLNLPEEYIEQLLTVDPNLDNDWVEIYYHDLDKSLYFDYFLVVNLRAIDVTPDRVSEEDRMVRRKVEDGFEYVLDKNGNVVKDSLGNDVKTPKYKILACTVIETLQQKDVKIEGDLEIISENPRRMIKREPLVATGAFEHYSARAVGDLEALDDETRKRVENQKVPFPTDIEMVMRTTDLFRQAVASAIRRNRQYIR